MKKNIVLCDFNHTMMGVHNEVMPLGIGHIGSFIMQNYPGMVDIRLYKFVDEFLDDIKIFKPDLMGLALYSWNTKLNLHIARHTKNIFPELIVIGGGPNIPSSRDETLRFFNKHPFVDIIIDKDGEIPCSQIVQRILHDDNREELIHSNIPGTSMFDQNNNELIQNSVGARINSLDEVHSPYINGLMSKFFKYSHIKLAPFIETNRGCPHTCTFCYASGEYYSKLIWASIDKLKQELEYFGLHFRNQHNVRLFVADNNFGIYEQDCKFAELVRGIQEKYNWPRYVYTTTGKIRPQKILETASKFKWGFKIDMSLQSLDDKVLKNIKRKNIEFDRRIQLQNEGKKKGLHSTTDIILGLPYETKETFLLGIKKVLGAGIDKITVITLIKLNGTTLKEQLNKHPKNYLFKHRIVPRQIGIYFGEPIFDAEEVVVQTPTLSFSDYLYCRGFSLIIQSIHNTALFPELEKFLKENNVHVFDWLLNIYERLRNESTVLASVLTLFLEETTNELFDSEEALHKYYQQDNKINKLLSYDLSANLLAKYTNKLISRDFPSLVELAIKTAAYLLNKSHKKNDLSIILDDFNRLYINSRNIEQIINNGTKLKEKTYINLTYDIMKWYHDSNTVEIRNYKEDSIQYLISFSKDQFFFFKSLIALNEKDFEVKMQYYINHKAQDLFPTVEKAP